MTSEVDTRASNPTDNVNATTEVTRSVSPEAEENSNIGEISNPSGVERNNKRKHKVDPSQLDKHRVHVRNLNVKCTDDELRALFSEVGKVRYIHLVNVKTKDGKNKLVADISFVDPVAEQACETMGGRVFREQELGVQQVRQKRNLFYYTVMNKMLGPELTPEEVKCFRRDSEYIKQELAEKIGETYGLSVDFLAMIGIRGPLFKFIRILHLPKDCTKSEAGLLCSVGGHVEGISVTATRKGNCMATAEMGHPLEAVQTISMLRGKVYKGQLLDVFMYYTAAKQGITRLGLTGSYSMTSQMPPGLERTGMGLGVKGRPLFNLSDKFSSVPSPSVNIVHPLASHQQNLWPLACKYENTGMTTASYQQNMSLMGSLPQTSGEKDPLFKRNRIPKLMSLDLSSTTHVACLTMANLSISNAPLPGTTKYYEVEITNVPYQFFWNEILKLCQLYADPVFGKCLQPGVWRVYFDRRNDALRLCSNINGMHFYGYEVSAKLL